MTVYKYCTVWCDNSWSSDHRPPDYDEYPYCHHHLEMHVGTVREARTEARLNGWIFTNKRDLCPVCSEKEGIS